MKLEQFHYLLEIHRLHSISAAARSLHIVQTTLSAIVKSVEAELGFPLFQRNPSGVATTPAGENFMDLAWEINVKYEELLAVKHLSVGGAPSITVLMSPSLIGQLAIPLAQRFSAFELRGNLIIDETESELVGERILNNAGNIGLTYLTEIEIQKIQKDSRENELQIERLLEDELCILVSKDHRFSNRNTIDIQELSGEQIASGNKARNDKIIGNFLRYSNQVTRLSSFDLMFQAVRDYRMIGFVPKFVAIRNCEPDFQEFRVIPLKNTERVNRMYLCLLTAKKRNLRYQESILLSCIHSYFGELSHPHDKTQEEIAL